MTRPPPVSCCRIRLLHLRLLMIYRCANNWTFIQSPKGGQTNPPSPRGRAAPLPPVAGRKRPSTAGRDPPGAPLRGSPGFAGSPSCLLSNRVGGAGVWAGDRKRWAAAKPAPPVGRLSTAGGRLSTRQALGAGLRPQRGRRPRRLAKRPGS